MKFKTQDIKPNPMLASREQRTENREQKTENRKQKMDFCHPSSVVCHLTSVVLFFAGVTIASEQADPANLSTPQVIAPHQLDAPSRSIGAGSPDVNAPNRPRDGNWLNDLNQLPITSYQLPITNHGQNLSIPSSQDAQQLWRSSISVAQSPPDKKYKDKLWRLIEQIRSIRFEPKNQAPEPVIVASPVPTVEPNETLSPAVTLAESAGGGEKQPQHEPDSPLPYEPISNKTLQMLENLSQQPTQLYKAFELAEILFLSGNLKQAAMFYQHALNRKDPNDVTSAQDRAWILFQIGNCLIRSDLPAAKKMYRQLIIEYPNCPWTDLAKARENLIDWYLNDKPRALITECKSYLSADGF